MNAGFVVGTLTTGFVLAAMSIAATFAVLAAVFAASLAPLRSLRLGRGGSRRVGRLFSIAGHVAGTRGLREAVTIGVGSVVGTALFVSARRRRWLGTGVIGGAVVPGLTIVGVAAVPAFAAAIAALGAGGVGYAVAEVGSVTIVQQHATDEARVHLLGVVESMRAGSYAVGAAVAGALASRVVVQHAFVWMGSAALTVAVALGAGLVAAGHASPLHVRFNARTRDHLVLLPTRPPPRPTGRRNG